jgi:cyclopropane fatty-acyl-phospholipid synthase-like methyltransferase
LDKVGQLTDWYKYWNSAPAAMSERDYLSQVGKTVNGQPIAEVSLIAMVDDVVNALELNGKDSVLDLCCGNGVITYRCAQHCLKVAGVDFSEPLIRIARSHFERQNVEYILADIRQLPETVTRRPCSKVYMYEAIQHFSTEEVESLLHVLQQSDAREAPIFFASVPDNDRLWEFYNTPARRSEYHRRLREGTEAIGHWWTSDEMIELGQRCGYSVEIRSPNPILHVAHYRFDALFIPEDAA